jgi:two-component system, NarL family, response regulator DevR
MPKHNMMIVEDHEPTRFLLGRIFSLEGWAVAAVGSVAEGLSLLAAGPVPCCLILDIDLPDGSGAEVLSRSRELGHRTRVVVSSGTQDGIRLREIMELTPDSFLPKPIAIGAVWDDLCRVCDGEMAGPDMP